MSVRSAGEIFGEAETLALYLGIEVALAHAQAEVGVIPRVKSWVNPPSRRISATT